MLSHIYGIEKLAGSRRVLHGRTGNLKRSIGSEVSGIGQAAVFSDTKYGRRHNEGLDGMPKRQFIGENEAVAAVIKIEIETRLSHIFNN